MRDRLIELLEAECGFSRYMTDDERRARLADHLLANGIIVPPCKVGDTVFFATCVDDGESEEKYDTLEGECISFSLQNQGLLAYCRYKCGLTYWHLVEQDFGKTVFLTREEAEKALERRNRQ
jgi:hypothetical protein